MYFTFQDLGTIKEDVLMYCNKTIDRLKWVQVYLLFNLL